MQQSPKMTAPEDKTLSTRIRPHMGRLKAALLLINGIGKREERTQKKCPGNDEGNTMCYTPLL